MGAGLPPPVGLLSVDAAVVVYLDLAVAAEKSNGILPVVEVALAVLVISVEDGLFVTLSGDDALGDPGAEEVHQAVGLEGGGLVDGDICEDVCHCRCCGIYGVAPTSKVSTFILTLQRYIKFYMPPNILAEKYQKRYIFMVFGGVLGRKGQKTATIITDGGGPSN